MPEATYIQWIVLAIKIAIIWLAIILVINAIFYRDKTKSMARMIYAKVKGR